MSYLPEPFKDMEPFAATWSLATESERNRQRRASTMEQLQAFYDAVLPRMDSIITYLNQYSLNDMPDAAQRLFYLALSFMEVSPSVELLHEPDEAGVFEAERFKIIEA